MTVPHLPGRKTVLFICSVQPNLAGYGMTMRVGFQVLSLAKLFDVTLLVLSASRSEDDATRAIGPDIKASVTEVLVVGGHSPYSRLRRRLSASPQLRVIFDMLWPSPMRCAYIAPLLKKGLIRLGDRSFDALHCVGMENGIAPKLMAGLGISAGFRVLDINDYESRAAPRAAQVLRRSHGFQYAVATRLEALKWRAREWRDVPRFDVNLLCSALDAQLLARRFRGQRFDVAPNVVRSPRPLDRKPNEAFTFLFVGHLGYEPNRDAILYFSREILPSLRRGTTRAFRVLIVGRAPDETILALAEQPDIEVVAGPDSVEPFYAAADVAIVPIRAGGGTRIKILEAMSYGVAVVSTSVGMEGLDAEPGKNVLVGDDAERFADCCRQLMVDDEQRKHIADAGRALFQERYSAEALDDVFSRIYSSVVGSTVSITE